MRVAPPLLLAVSIFAFGAELLHLRAERTVETATLAYVPAFGSAATKRTNATLQPANESISIDGKRDAASAEWKFPAVAATLARDTTIEGASVFVSESSLRVAQSDGFVDVAVDGRTIAHIVARPVVTSTGVRTYAIANADAVPLAVPPGLRVGFRLPIASGEACRDRPCTVAISLRGARWNVGTVALLLVTRAAPARAIWMRPPSVVLALLACFGLALLSHGLISLTNGRSRELPVR